MPAPRSTPALIAFMRLHLASASWRGDLIDAAVALCGACMFAGSVALLIVGFGS